MTTTKTLESTVQPSKDQVTRPAVLITGALTGIGRATALAFAREGARIVVSGRHDDKGNALVSELQEIGAEATFIKSDVRHDDEVRALVDETVKQFGRLDVAVNNAGTEGNPGPLTDQTAESYAATFDTNVLGTLLSMKHELRVMLPQGSGSIVNVSSTYGRTGAPGASVYVASKHAVEGLTKSAALEAAGSGVRVVLVNNAGTAIPKTFDETTLEEMDRMIEINVRGTLVATQAALKHMKSGGRIIMIGSSVGERVLAPGLVAYSATKGAVKMFTQGLSREIGSRGITVNNVQPGPIDTDLNPAAGDWAVPQKAATALDRYGHVDEVAALVAFVASPESSYITGANLTVDGGTNA